MENYITSELIESTYLFCAKRISDSEAAKDLSQDILLTALQNISMGKQFVSFNSWYWRMARNKYADLIEARQMIRELPLDEALNVRDMSVQPIDAMISREQLSELNFSLSRLAAIYLSGGEQQRIAIARAILKNAPIIILDEATAFADPDNETKVQADFGELAKGKTVIMIAHRLSTVVNTDRIYVLKDGTVAQSGKHDELMRKGGIFASMVKSQTEGQNWAIA